MNNYYSMNEASGKRDITFDIAKGIGIFLVIIGHMPNFMPEWIRSYISSFHMPLFFFISGYFAKEIKHQEKFVAKLKKITSSMMHMYIEYSIVFMLLEFAALNYDFRHLAKSVENIFLGHGGYYVLWFLFSLYLVEVMFYILNFRFNKRMDKLAILIVLVGFVCGKVHFNWLKIGSSLYAFGFFYLGFVFHKHELLEKVSRTKVLVPVMLIHYCLVVVLYKRYGYILEMVANQSVDILLNYYIAVSGIILVISTAKVVQNSRIAYVPLAYIGKHSIYFYPLTAFIPDYCKLLIGSTPIIKILSRVLSFPITIVYMKARERVLICLRKN